jgi:RNA polymerase sigma factor (sigma-70 family)
MRGGPLGAQWPEDDGRTPVRWSGPALVGAVIDRPRLDADAARRLGLFAYNVARKFFPHRADLVEEAVQETLARTWERWERANQRGCPEAWVVNTATNVCHEKLREERRGARWPGLRPAPTDGADDVVRSELLADALRRLTSRQRVVIVWRYLFDFSVQETADALGLTESKVRDASHNGVSRLRKLLGEEWDGLT